MNKPNALETARAKAAEKLRAELTRRLNADVDPAAAVARLQAAGVDATLEGSTVRIHMPTLAVEPIVIHVTIGGAK